MKLGIFFEKYREQTPLWIAAIPLAVLIITLAGVIKCFGSDSIMGVIELLILFFSM